MADAVATLPRGFAHSGRTATVPSDENLEAKPQAAAGGSRWRRGQPGRTTLTRPPPPYHQKGFHRLDMAASRMARNFLTTDKKFQIHQSLIYKSSSRPLMRTDRLRSAARRAGVTRAEPQTEARTLAAVCGCARDERVFQEGGAGGAR